MILKRKHPKDAMWIDDKQSVTNIASDIEITPKVENEMKQEWFKVWVKIVEDEPSKETKAPVIEQAKKQVSKKKTKKKVSKK